MSLMLDFFSMDSSQKFMTYMATVKDYLIADAVFSDETANFRNPVEPKSSESVTVKIRTAKDNCDEVFLIYEDKKIKMEKCMQDELFDYYQGLIPPVSHTLSYHFELKKNEISYYYNKKGLLLEKDPFFDFKIIPDFSTPAWAKGAVMYQIFVDRFYNGDPTNDVLDNEYIYAGKPSQQVKDWYKYPEVDGIREFYGGDLKGVIDKLVYLKELGVEAIYFNPIFVSPSNHKYDIQDYDYIDPHFGVIVEDGGELLSPGKFHNKYASKYIKRTTDLKNLEASNALMIELINKAHEYGIKVILDGVFNHCGSFNKWMDREGFYEGLADYQGGAYRSKESPYHNYFSWYHHNWPNNDCYHTWNGFDTLPKLNYEGSQELFNHIINIGRKWVSPPYNADGWRLDVAAELGYSKEFNHHFWREFRKAVKEANPNAIILAEHYGDSYDWIQGDQWDTVMNYDGFMDPVSYFLTGIQKHSDHYREDLLGNSYVFKDAMKYHMSRFSYQSLYTAMIQLSNHDHSRFLTRTNRTVGRIHTMGPEAASQNINKGIMKMGVVIQMTWPGAPTIYYGDEAGLAGWTDPDNRRTYPWGREDQELLNFHKEIIRIHKSYQALKTGSLEFLLTDYKVLSYGRWDMEHAFVIALNMDDVERELFIPVWKIGISNTVNLERIFFSDKETHSTQSVQHEVSNGHLCIKMPPYSSMIFIN
ncbi:MAG TPA: glycoside hydrolase family 13 protein [Defluviitaleaceae bacterium]|nr:glycoside hydrolase family 13 protein [Defluviitaleaceae bacterium]HPT76588.1 glycoside hydrolase family 13 protein [Defluviitaleaceae bacterium]HQD50971.1 glycoside hydrolase family 13 protein [Defluviitaleaceae bacterium]